MKLRRWMAALLAGAVLLTACTPSSEDGDETPGPEQQSEPPNDLPAADEAVQGFVEALAAEDISQIPMQSTAADAQAEYETIFAGMDGAVPETTVEGITYDPSDNSAIATLSNSLNIGQEPWTYETEASFKWVNEAWRLEWAPTILHSQLNSELRMRQVGTDPTRSPINDKDGVALVEEVALYEVGIDKANLEQALWGSSARQLAEAFGIDADDFEARVLGGGERQFVIAQTVRQVDIPSSVSDIPGMHVNEISSVEAPNDGFASSILGTVGPPTAEMIEESDGQLTSADVVGLSGLQSRYDDQLGGVSGVRVELVPRAEESSQQTEVVFEQEESVGSPLDTSLDRDLQTKAEDVLASQSGVATLVVVDVETGGVSVVANSPAAGSYPHGTWGRYAPGSTFKVASALALLRKGMTPDSTVDCTNEHTISGYTFGNHSGYSHTGDISLTDAIAYSCNTAFTHASESLTGEELHAAASSLGVGTDYDAGYRVYFGTVEPQNSIDLAASMIGQGQVTTSPLAMAGVAASVAKGETVIPWLVEGQEAESTADPLTAEEAAALQRMMEATVDYGTGTMLQSVATGAKSGTAEFGTADDMQTHGWMIAYNDQYAVAAFVEEGSSGGTDAAPLIQQLLS